MLALTTLLLQLTDCTTSLPRLGFDRRTLLPPLFEDVARIRMSGELPRAVEEFTRILEMRSRGGLGTTVGVLIRLGTLGMMVPGL